MAFRFVILNLECLEERVYLNGDTLAFKPQMLPDGTYSQKASLASNWFDVSQNRQGVEAPGSGANGGQTIQLYHQYDQNSPVDPSITWDIPDGSSAMYVYNVAAITYAGSGGARGGPAYAGTQTIKSGVTLDVAGGISLGGSSLNVNFQGPANDTTNGSYLSEGGIATNWYGFNFNSIGVGVCGNVTIKANTTVYTGFTNQALIDDGVVINVLGSLQYEPDVVNVNAPIAFQNEGYLTVGTTGTFGLTDANLSPVAFCSSDGLTSEVIVNYGTLAFSYSQVDTCAVPIQNFGSLTFQSAGGSAAKLTISGRTSGLNGNTYSLVSEATGTAAAFMLIQNASTVVVQNGFYAQGTTGFQSIVQADSTSPGDTLQTLSSNIEFGNKAVVKWLHSPSAFGVFNLIGSVQFDDGSFYEPGIDGSNAANADCLLVTGTLNFKLATCQPIISGSLNLHGTRWKVFTASTWQWGWDATTSANVTFPSPFYGSSTRNTGYVNDN